VWLFQTQTCIPHIPVATLRPVAEVELSSVPSGDARRTPRVDFSAQVELLARDERDDEQRVLVAQALDLGAGGIGLSMRERLPIGTKVTCRLELDGRDAALPGRVAWSRSNTSPRPHGLGVCFDNLAEHERELLSHVVDRTQAGYRPVELRFEGAQAPLIARACPTSEGLRVSTPLPMLNQGAELSVRFEGEGQAFTGRITSVVVRDEDGTRRLEVELALSDAASVRFRRQARYGYADELNSAVDDGTLDAEPMATTTTGRHPARPRRVAASAYANANANTIDDALEDANESSAPNATAAHTHPGDAQRRPLATVVAVLRIAGSLLLAASCGALLSAWLERSWHAFEARPGSPPIVIETAPESSAPDAARGDGEAASPVGEQAASSVKPEVAEHAVAEHAPLVVPASEAVAALDPARTAQTATPLSAPAQVPASAAVAPKLNANQPATSAIPSSTPSPAAAPETSGALLRATPTLVVEHGVTVIAVPFAGSLDGMQTRTWAAPLAIAIDLPHGHALIEHGDYRLTGGAASGLRVRERNQQLLVRVMLAHPVSRIAVTAQRESLEIRLTPEP